MLFFASALLALSSLVSVRALTGEVTFYTPGLGACGISNTENDFVAAISHFTFDTFPGATPNPNLNPICGRNLRATYQGKSVVVKVVDKCPGCGGANDVDMSPIAFRVLAPEAVGRLFGVEWDWTDSAPGPARKREESARSNVINNTHRMVRVRSAPHAA
ncbi:RlpA-like double-psi beta-barrel-protein domain-containing protein-containing protein [Collybia nuda]|uniref:RlpA-like double-psi beta-barrel-protein domain-containing protein-containing protein n=1 Tax=Collybia nuda TaxID=64659 RepID=A0A9P5YE81_9AGAR|nr:RlpA-like double-psi beta-barrel-protein domain-containing protein-containing protein [Collybia nuda]